MKNLVLYSSLLVLTSSLAYAQQGTQLRRMASYDSIQKETRELDNVLTADTIHINVSSSACFGGEEYALSIVRIGNHYTYLLTDKYGQNNEKIIGTFSSTQMLNIKKLFIKGINLERTGFCTTSVFFTASASTGKAVFLDDRCNPGDDCFNKLKEIVAAK